jgi:transposase
VFYGLFDADGYPHGMLRHGAEQHARYNHYRSVTHHTNSVENFWWLLKAAARSTHIHVSAK